MAAGRGEGDDVYLSSIELFPRPPSDTCSIPDLPQIRISPSLSILSGGRLVVCGGHVDSCISWVAGNTNWTHLYTMRCLPIKPHQSASTLPNTITVWGEPVTRPGRQPLFLTPLCCWAAVKAMQCKLQQLQNQSLQRLCQVLNGEVREALV